MMLEEFEKLTGFYPTLSLYEAIEVAYTDFGGDKADFCEAYRANKDGLAEAIQRKADMERIRTDRETEKRTADLGSQIADLQNQITALQESLDKELEWTPYEGCGTNMSQERYEALMASCTGHNGDPHVMSEEEAKQLVAEEFGFNPERIEIITTVHTYEVNKYHQLRKAAAYTRQPLYDATDWNYVRFNVRGAGTVWYYEMINGDIKGYCC